jgi:hypothetical protein
MKITLATVAIQREKKWNTWQLFTLNNHELYCKKHGYSWEYLHSPHILNSTIAKTGRNRFKNGFWWKYPFVESLLHKYDVVVSVDMDALFMNMSITIESIVLKALQKNPSTKIILTADTSLINTGQIIYLKDEWTINWLNEVNAFPDGMVPLNEQGAAMAWLSGCNSTSSNIDMLNCYRNSDQGYLNEKIARYYRLGTWQELEVHTNESKKSNHHMYWLPQRALNSYANGMILSAKALGLDESQGFELEDIITKRISAYNITKIDIHSCRTVQSSGGADVTYYQPGDFIVHTAGHGIECKAILLNYFETYRQFIDAVDQTLNKSEANHRHVETK